MGKKASASSQLRWRILLRSLGNFSRSPLCLAGSALLVSVLFAILKDIYWPLVATLALGGFLFRAIVFEVFLMVHVIESSLGLWDWYTRIDEGLYLGAIPMESLQHLSNLTLDLGITAVLTVNEKYELGTRTIAGKPIQPEDWKVIALQPYLAFKLIDPCSGKT